MKRPTFPVAGASSASLLLLGCTDAKPQPTPSLSPSSAPPAQRSPTSIPSPPSTTDSGVGPGGDRPLPEGPGTALLIGTDSRTSGDMAGDADTMMLAHLTGDRSTVYQISLTRDMWTPIPGMGEGKLNAALSNGGTPTLSETVAGLLGGFEIDDAAQSNFEGFFALTRALDGIPVVNKHASTVTVTSTGRELAS